MLRSLYSGISGMGGFKTQLDTIGNNIANVNTTGYKKARTSFEDMFSQTMSAANSAANGLGGTNPVQVGLGSSVGSIDTINTQGSFQTTGRTLDLALDGDGMFKLAEWNGAAVNPTYTRAGNFYLDEDGYMVNGNGKYVIGDNGRIEIPTTTQSFSIGNDGTITIVDQDGNATSNQQIQVSNFANEAGLNKVGGNEYAVSNNSGVENLNAPGTNGNGSIVSGALEMSNVDLAEELTSMITAQRGFQANTRIITTSDEILQELVNLKR
ncbi:flagellar basal body rod protein FlgG [Pontibacillus halophilus JSM 076056 = DSM 19796]|uniref:Flagellar hook protein FlgE n=1 Tax=Pontibacillus halophilus JSM 076056 = DSM 19796 TaxID=1385510 RepID=A0A0A5IBF0_9BACI|nr:flagellar basal body rod protein FlgG [Pontibacillus halophilus]KGX93167.1 flagellar basal body rod protein FlgG [Pontibacillus halophilus JSM 076056 = DSM 19796]